MSEFFYDGSYEKFLLDNNLDIVNFACDEFSDERIKKEHPYYKYI